MRPIRSPRGSAEQKPSKRFRGRTTVRVPRRVRIRQASTQGERD